MLLAISHEFLATGEAPRLDCGSEGIRETALGKRPDILDRIKQTKRTLCCLKELSGSIEIAVARRENAVPIFFVDLAFAKWVAPLHHIIIESRPTEMAGDVLGEATSGGCDFVRRLKQEWEIRDWIDFIIRKRCQCPTPTRVAWK
jgi:hypothetical protein